MRVGLIVYGSLDVLSGGNLYDRTLVGHLRGESHKVDVIPLRHRSYALDLLHNASRSLRRVLGDTTFDLVLQDELAHPSLFRVNRRANTRLVSIVHHLRSSEDRPRWHNDLYRKVEKAYLDTIDAFVFNSETTRESVESLLQKKTRSVVATPGGDRLAGASSVSAESVARRTGIKGPLRLLFVGNVIPRKGLHDLLTALAPLRDRDWHLDVVGSLDSDPGYVEDIRRRARMLDLVERLTLHGTLEGNLLAEKYATSQLLVMPSSYEGFGIVYLEAMSFGLPVIANMAGAVDEIVRHESTGFLVHPGDTWSLGRQIERVMDDRELLARMSLASLEAFRDHPTWRSSMEKISAFLTDLSRA
jgi:glycosyltransferase involved in cell wall biosynthesis